MGSFRVFNKKGESAHSREVQEKSKISLLYDKNPTFVKIWTGAQQTGSRRFLSENGENISINEDLLPSGFASKLTMVIIPEHKSILFMNR